MCRRPVCHREGQAGFTLIELVVVVGLISIVLAILTLGVSRASDAFSLRRGASVATSELRRAHAGAVSDGVDYVVEFVLANPGSLKIYRSTATSQTCPTGMMPPPPATSTLCTRTIADQQWPSSVAINNPGTTFAACSAPADTANKCVTFKPLGYAETSSTCSSTPCKVQLTSRSGTTLNVEIALSTGRVSVQP